MLGHAPVTDALSLALNSKIIITRRSPQIKDVCRRHAHGVAPDRLWAARPPGAESSLWVSLPAVPIGEGLQIESECAIVRSVKVSFVVPLGLANTVKECK